MSKYFIKQTQVYSPKNKLHKDVQVIASSLNRLMVDAKDLDKVVRNYIDAVAKANLNNPRSHGVEVIVRNPTYKLDKDYQLIINDVVTLTIYLVKGEVEL